MTDFDKRLIEKANQLSHYQHGLVCQLVSLADTERARNILLDLAWEFKESVKETL